VKVWTGYESEHSYRLIMVGHFTDATKAAATKEKFDRLAEHVTAQLDEGTMDVGWGAEERMNESLLQALTDLGLYDLSVTDASNFAYDFDTTQDGSRLTLSTDEGAVQGFLKVMLDAGARIEVFSRHNWTEAGDPVERAAD
jgi:Family of unknown function (DUF6375)